MKNKWITGLFILALVAGLTSCEAKEPLVLTASTDTVKGTKEPLASDIPTPSDYPNPLDYPNPSNNPIPSKKRNSGEANEKQILTLTDVTLPAGYGAESSWIDIYFTDPDSPLASQETGGVEEKLVQSIDSARLTLDMAIYSISLGSVRDAIIRAHERGVQVRMVMESNNLADAASQALEEAGIPILGDRREGLMHDKFVVIDRSETWLGSMNFTYSGAYEDNNSLIHIRSSKIAENYTKEFDEMFVDDKFGEDVVSATPNQVTVIDGTTVETYFSPDDGVAEQILKELQDAKKSIYFMAFSFTEDELGAFIREKAAEGLKVEGVMDAEQVKSNIGTEYIPFVQNKMDVYIDGNEGQMHHKTIIIDGKIVITGSYNFSRSAETRNDENVVFIYSKEIAELFMKEFEKIYAQAQK